MRCVLHIGTTKTGTSSIQKTFAAQTGVLTARNIHYIAAGRVFGEITLKRNLGFRYAMRPIERPANYMQTTLGMTNEESRLKYKQNFIRDFDREISSLAPDATVLISDEALFASAEKATADNALAFLSQRFGDIAIIAYLRRPDLHLASRYSQHIKLGGKLSLTQFVTERADKKMYFERLDIWAASFGNQRLTIRPFDRQRLVGGDVVKDLCTQIGLEFSDLDIIRSNQSLTPLGCALMRQVNRLYQGKPPKLVRATFDRLLTGAGVRIPPTLVGRVHALWREDHRRVVDNFLAGREENLYRLDDMLSTDD